MAQILEDYPTSQEALQFAGLDFEVTKRPIYAIPECTPEVKGVSIGIDIPNRFATVRTDRNTALGVVGRDYEVVQNRDAFSFFDCIVGGDSGILYETAGALGTGERIFITANAEERWKEAHKVMGMMSTLKSMLE